MSSKIFRAALAALLVTVVASVAAAPAGAYSSSERKYERAQTGAITFLKRRATALGLALGSANSAIRTLQDRLDKLEGRVDKAEAAAGAVEYGVARVYVNGTTAAATFVSPDIPDVGQPAAANGSVPLPVGGAVTLTLRGAIRSNESDGTGAGNPAGQAGGVLYAICGTAGGCGGVPTGTIVCSSGPPTAQNFATPVGTKSLNLVNINTKATIFDTDAPAAGDTDIANGACSIPTAGTYNVVVTSSFVDIPTAPFGPSD